ncbi:GNAT family N-acetyltransferase [Aestuariivirga sp.]|uniref:GNAT family N-acetyltransferase n=1 Tax=Aestuariivirga sp. TaxID=2650926 RepID=UPI0030195FCE
MIRPGQIADLPAIMRIRTSVAENHLSVEQMVEIGITNDSIAAEMTDGDLGCWVAMDGGEITGFSMADRRDGSIFALFMDANHEGKGHGSALLAACEAWLKQRGHAEAHLTTGRDTKAFAFYRRRGWQETSKTAEHFAEDAVMVKSI